MARASLISSSRYRPGTNDMMNLRPMPSPFSIDRSVELPRLAFGEGRPSPNSASILTRTFAATPSNVAAICECRSESFSMAMN